MRNRLLAALAILLLASPPALRAADNLGPQNFVVLRVEANDQSTTTYTQDQVKSELFDKVAQLWSQNSSFGKLEIQFQISNLYQLPGKFTDYIDQPSPEPDLNGELDHSSPPAFYKAVSDAVSHAPAGLDWTKLRGIVVFLADTRPDGFTRGVTYSSVAVQTPSGNFNLPVTLITENPIYPKEKLPRAWGRIAHEIGHALQQQVGPGHPSNYNSDYEEMDNEYPAQTGVFEKQSAEAFSGWLPPGKYVEIHPAPTETTTMLRAAEQDPGGSTDAQAVRAYLGFGGDSLYYLVSVRRRVLGDDLNVNQPLPPGTPTDCDLAATPNGIPDCGVLIERVVEGGDPTVRDCDPNGSNCINRWVHVLGNLDPNGKANSDKLWHDGDVYKSSPYSQASSTSDNVANVASDGIVIAIKKGSDRDHYSVAVSYNGAPQPDVGLSDWLRPPSNSYETTDIWVDSPVNGYASPADTDAAAYRYGVQPDLKGGKVPKGGGDDPAIGQLNRIYARVRNFGAAPATDVTVHFDVTDPPGLGISGSNGFREIGAVTSAQFPALASIRPGGVADVFIDWTPNVPLTPAQLAAGTFAFNTGLRVRIDHVAGETFFANQDGDGEQENIGYLEANGPSAPAATNQLFVHLRNDSATAPKTFSLALLRDNLPPSWQVDVNKGVPLVTLAPAEVRDIPIAVRQSVAEPIGSRHQLRVTASSEVTLSRLNDMPHTEIHPLGGATIEVGVVRRTTLQCRVSGGLVGGVLKGLDPSDHGARVYLVQVDVTQPQVKFATSGSLAVVGPNGQFVFHTVPQGKQAVCLYAGSSMSASAASPVFPD
jgi:hypothetical protein